MEYRLHTPHCCFPQVPEECLRHPFIVMLTGVNKYALNLHIMELLQIGCRTAIKLKIIDTCTPPG